VLQPFRKADFDLLETVLQRTVSAIELLIREGIEKAMTFYNRTDDNQA
jgi:peptidyl-tRNA hydrolase